MDWRDVEKDTTLEADAYNYCTEGYHHVLTSGLPVSHGKYFIVFVNDPGIYLVNLQLEENGSRIWSGYRIPGEIQESQIRLWKRIKF